MPTDPAARVFTRESLPPIVRDFDPRVGLVLGTGLGPVVERFEARGEIAYGEIPGLPVSRVTGHAGRFLLGTLAGARFLVAQGRVHLYEGHTAWTAASHVRWMAAAGIRTLILTNAAGCANPAFSPGGWMLLSDHINLTGQSPLTGAPAFHDMSAVYSPRLRELVKSAAARARIPLHEGVYAAVPGPQYETPAEVRMLHALGADAVGMSTVPEAIQARALELETCGLSCLTNWAAGVSASPLEHDDVIDVGRQAAGALAVLLEAVAPGFAADGE